MKKLLCPIDFSEVSLNALEFAVAIGEKENSTLTLINIFTPSNFNKIIETDHVKEEYEQRLATIESNLIAISKEINKTSKKKGLLICDFIIKSGEIIDILSDIVSTEKYDLIVIGTTGHSAYKIKYLGGIAEKIIQQTHCSILCAPGSHNFHGINKIVYATDYLEEDKLAIQQLIAMAVLFKANVEILHVSHHDDTIDKAMFEEYKDELTSFVKYEKISFNRVVVNHVAKGIDDYMNEIEADLLVFLNKKNNFIKSLIHNSLTLHLEKFTDYPLMIIKL